MGPKKGNRFRVRARERARNSANRQRSVFLALPSAALTGRTPARALLSARELEALDADTQGYSFTGPEAAELELECAKRAEEARASACSRRQAYTLQKALASKWVGGWVREAQGILASNTDDFGNTVPLLFPQQQEGGDRCRKVPLAVAPVLTYLQEVNAGAGLATTILANSPPPREWGVGANNKTLPAQILLLVPRLWKAKRGPRKSSHLPKHLHHGGWSRRNLLWAPLTQKSGVSL
jgi:hypothetical protein